MSGETNLQTLLAGMRPHLSETGYAFGIVGSADEISPGTRIIGTFVEDEGLTIIGPSEDLDWANLERSGTWAKISLTAHSSLSAVGLTAKLASALADQGISANVVAAFFHDHIFVPWDKRFLAMEILTSLGRSTPDEI
jgi:hypothetical protein